MDDGSVGFGNAAIISGSERPLPGPKVNGRDGETAGAVVAAEGSGAVRLHVGTRRRSKLGDPIPRIGVSVLIVMPSRGFAALRPLRRV